MIRRSTARAVALGAVIGVACLLPWAYAGVPSWAWRPASSLLVLALAIFVVAGGGAGALAEKRPPWLGPAAALCLWAALQLLPLPAGVLRQISPGEAARLGTRVAGYGVLPPPLLLDATHAAARAELPPDLPPAPLSPPGVREPTSSIAAPGRHAISIAPAMTAECLAWYVALLAAAVTLWGCLGDERRRSAATLALFCGFGALALVALAHVLVRRADMLWFRTIEGARPLGPYVNPRHFAGAMEMAVPWMAAGAAARFREGPRSRAAGAVIALGAGLAFLAGLAGQSRLAALTMSAGLSVVALVAVPRASRRRAVAILGAAWVLGAAAVLATPLGERFSVLVAESLGAGEQDRWVMWKAMLPAVRTFWLTGAGYGTFRWLAPAYVPAGDGGRWLQLHCDWLESALSGGVIGFCLLLAVAGTLAYAATARLRAAASRGEHLERVGLAVGLTSLAVHAFVDFNHQIPANALLFVALGAFATSESRMSRSGAS